MPETLLLGQIGDAGATPVAGAKVFYLTRDSYGSQVASTGGVDGAMVIETEDLFPASDAGLVVLRRCFLKVGIQFGACNLRVSVIVDGSRVAHVKAFTLPTPTTGREIHDLEVEVAVRCNAVRLRIERITNTARFELLKWYAGVRPQKNVNNVVGTVET